MPLCASIIWRRAGLASGQQQQGYGTTAQEMKSQRKCHGAATIIVPHHLQQGL
jgi:hypothetical protein